MHVLLDVLWGCATLLSCILPRVTMMSGTIELLYTSLKRIACLVAWCSVRLQCHCRPVYSWGWVLQLSFCPTSWTNKCISCLMFCEVMVPVLPCMHTHEGDDDGVAWFVGWPAMWWDGGHDEGWRQPGGLPQLWFLSWALVWLCCCVADRQFSALWSPHKSVNWFSLHSWNGFTSFGPKCTTCSLDFCNSTAYSSPCRRVTRSMDQMYQLF